MNGHQVLEMIRQLQRQVAELQIEVGNIREGIPKPNKVQTDEIKRPRSYQRNRTESA